MNLKSLLTAFSWKSAVISLGNFGDQFGWPEADDAGRRKIFDDHLDYTLGFLHFLGTEKVVPEELRKDVRCHGLHSGEFADNGHLPYQLRAGGAPDEGALRRPPAGCADGAAEGRQHRHGQPFHRLPARPAPRGFPHGVRQRRPHLAERLCLPDPIPRDHPEYGGMHESPRPCGGELHPRRLLHPSGRGAHG